MGELIDDEFDEMLDEANENLANEGMQIEDVDGEGYVVSTAPGANNNAQISNVIAMANSVTKSGSKPPRRLESEYFGKAIVTHDCATQEVTLRAKGDAIAAMQFERGSGNKLSFDKMLEVA